MKQYLLTPSAGKRLIAKATASHQPVLSALKYGIVVIIAGTTNGYVAEEILTYLRNYGSFSKNRFFRGITLPPGKGVTDSGRIKDESGFPGDIVLEKGKLQKGKTIFDVADNLKKGDIIIKGANAVNLQNKQAGILIGDPKGGTILSALQAVAGRRVQLILPVGLEKRVSEDIHDIAKILNNVNAQGARLMPVPGEVITEIEAVKLLTEADAHLVAAGGVCGAEGSVWLAVAGTAKQKKAADSLLSSIAAEPSFTL